MAISNEFRTRFLELVEEQELSHTVLAQKMGVQYDIFSKIKQYGIIPTPRVLIRIADYFNVSVEYLLGRTDNDFFCKSEKPESFSERVNALRIKNNLTFYALGKKLHISSNYFSDWKAKNYIPSLDYLYPIQDYFNVSLDYLLGRSDD